jgi:hypothetical protein
MKEASDALAEKFVHLTIGSQSVITTPRVLKQNLAAPPTELNKIDKNFNPPLCRTEHLSTVPELCVHVSNHIVSIPYRFDYQKCNNGVCCGAKETAAQCIDLALQRQPTPRLDSNRDRHFLAQSDALNAASSEAVYTDLADLPSNCGNEKKNEKQRFGKRDKPCPLFKRHVS